MTDSGFPAGGQAGGPTDDSTRDSPAGTASESATDVAGELQALLPSRSKARVALGAAVFVLALASAWAAPKVLAPHAEFGGAAVQQYFPDAPYVWAAAPIIMHGWPSATVVAVGDRPGAKAIAAWLTAEDQAEPFIGGDQDTALASQAALVEFTETTGVTVDQLQAVPPGVWVDADTNLLVLWQITDCDQAEAAEDTVPTTLTVRSSWGIKRQVTVGPSTALIGPTIMHDREEMEQLGICP